MFFDKSTPNGICVAPRDLWETPIIPHGHSSFRIRRKHGFLRSPLSFLSHRSRLFPQMQIHTACEKSVSICRTSGAICGLTNHPAWHLCCSVGSVGVPNHPAWQFFTQHSKDPIPHYKTTRLFAEAYTPNLRKSPLFRFPQSLSCFLLQDNQRHFLLPHDIAPRLQSLSNLRHKT